MRLTQTTKDFDNIITYQEVESCQKSELTSADRYWDLPRLHFRCRPHVLVSLCSLDCTLRGILNVSAFWSLDSATLLLVVVASLCFQYPG